MSDLEDEIQRLRNHVSSLDSGQHPSPQATWQSSRPSVGPQAYPEPLPTSQTYPLPESPYGRQAGQVFVSNFRESHPPRSSLGHVEHYGPPTTHGPAQVVTSAGYALTPATVSTPSVRGQAYHEPIRDAITEIFESDAQARNVFNV